MKLELSKTNRNKNATKKLTHNMKLVKYAVETIKT